MKVVKNYLSIKFALTLMFCIASTLGIYAQVTIGSSQPPENGALLVLKEYPADSTNNTSTRGLLYPRVQLEVVDELYPMYGSSASPAAEYVANKDALKASHAGLIVYNTTEENGFTKGLVIWNGSEWYKLKENPIVKAKITSLLCSSATITPNSYTKDSVYEGIIKIPYIGGNGGSYPSTEASAAINGLQIQRIAGTLAMGGGEVMYRIFGTPTVSSPTTTTFPIEFLDNTCNVTVGGDMAVNTIKYVRKTVPLDANTTVDSEVEFGNLIVRYTYSGGSTSTLRPDYSNMWVQFKTKINTHLLYWYEKTGAGASNAYMFKYGQVRSVANNWYTFIDGVTVAQNTDTGDLNARNRDIGRAIIVFQNDSFREIYRLSFNAYTSIGAVGVIPSAVGTYTIFIEKLE